MQLVFATNNAHKLQEVRQILPAAYEILSLSDIGFHEDIAETGTTLEENSLLKARTVMDRLKATQPERAKNLFGVIADDTGLEVEALNGAPGVYSARYAGEPTDSANNRRKLLQALLPYPSDQRQARFRTVVTLLRPSGEEVQLEGIVRGSIAEQEQGNGGFGYDALFIPEGYTRTFAQLTADEKNNISHRGRAIRQLRNYLSEL